MTGVTLGFIPEPLSVPVSSILPSRRIPAPVIESRKFKQIRTSIEEVGLIEPLSVTQADQSSGQHVLLDGHGCYFSIHERPLGRCRRSENCHSKDSFQQTVRFLGQSWGLVSSVHVKSRFPVSRALARKSF
jgi:hypothetical protein